MTVLIVDDDAGVRRWLQRKIPGETRCASSLMDGLQTAREWQPSVVLLDVLFPEEGSGLDYIAEFKQACPRAEVVVMTSFHRREDQARALAAGAFTYVEKSAACEEILLGAVMGARMMVSTVFVAGASVAPH